VGLAVVLASGFGVFDELYQHTTGRNAEILDWLADTAGAGVATLLYARWRAYRRLLEWPLLPPKAPGICQRRPAPVPVSTS
jgi:VanZ family protein